MKKIPVSWLKSKGIELSIGDGVNSTCGDGIVEKSEIVFLDQLHTSAGIFNDKHLIDFEVCITSFADRTNTGKQPVADDVIVDIKWDDGEFQPNRYASGFSWQITNHAPNVETWKQNFDALHDIYTKEMAMKKIKAPRTHATMAAEFMSDDQIKCEVFVSNEDGWVFVVSPGWHKECEYRLTQPKETTMKKPAPKPACYAQADDKPVFTQAMSRAGGKPHINMRCMVYNSLLTNAEYEEATIDFIGEWTCVYTSESCNERSCSIDDLLFKPIQTAEDKIRDALVLVINDECGISKAEDVCASLLNSDKFTIKLNKVGE